jgi:heme O synthase-like polyprenyltransferase
MTTLRTAEISTFERPWAYVVLTKPDVTFLVIITTVAGFYLGSRGSLDWLLLMHTLFGTMLVAAGTAALNQYFEREMDAVMRRTAARPLPVGLLQPREALRFGIGTILIGSAWLAFAVNNLAALLALATTVLYLGLYTPLKTRTTLATAVGAIPGALPPLIGWAAAAHGSLLALGCCSEFYFSGSFRTSWPSPGCIARTTPALASACFRSWTAAAMPLSARSWPCLPSWCR